VNDERIGDRSSFDTVDGLNGVGIGCVCGESIYRFGWQSHHFPLSQQIGGPIDSFVESIGSMDWQQFGIHAGK